jgi:hypothetical protein
VAAIDSQSSSTASSPRNDRFPPRSGKVVAIWSESHAIADHTGLTGTYDFRLEFSVRASGVPLSPGKKGRRGSKGQKACYGSGGVADRAARERLVFRPLKPAPPPLPIVLAYRQEARLPNRLPPTVFRNTCASHMTEMLLPSVMSINDVQ